MLVRLVRLVLAATLVWASASSMPEVTSAVAVLQVGEPAAAATPEATSSITVEQVAGLEAATTVIASQRTD